MFLKFVLQALGQRRTISPAGIRLLLPLRDTASVSVSEPAAKRKHDYDYNYCCRDRCFLYCAFFHNIPLSSVLYI